ncbi:MAG: hypothetical protein ABIN89_14550, partial [Chitinophagaceae bacterium]
EEVDYGRQPTWKTFPERLEESGVSWNVYQNEISLPSGLSSEDDSRLSNFTDNQARLLTCMCRENICFNLRKLIIQNQKRNLEPGTTRYLLVIV